MKNLLFRFFGPKFAKISLEDIPEVRSLDPFSTPILESGIVGLARPKKYRNGIERIRVEKLKEDILQFESWQNSHSFPV